MYLKTLLFYVGFVAFSLMLVLAINVKAHASTVRKALWKKVIVYLCITSALLSTTLLGPAFVCWMMAVIILVGLFEFLVLTQGHPIWGGLLGTGIVAAAIWGSMPLFHMVYSLVMIIALVGLLRTRGQKNDVNAVVYTGFGLTYIPFLGGHVLLLHLFPNFLDHFIFLYLLVIVSDAMGLLWGQLLGRHKIAPQLSPGKTWEGSVMSLASTMGSAYFLHFTLPAISTSMLIIIAGAVGVACQVGDIVASSFKRAAGVKDYGKWLPAFGGAMDRFDAFFFASPVYTLIIVIPGVST